MIIEMFILRILSLMSGTLTSHSAYELLEIEQNSKRAIDAYEAIVMGNII